MEHAVLVFQSACNRSGRKLIQTSTAAHCTVVNHADTFSWTVTCMTKLFTMVRELCLRWSLLRPDRQSGHTWQHEPRAVSCLRLRPSGPWGPWSVPAGYRWISGIVWRTSFKSPPEADSSSSSSRQRLDEASNLGRSEKRLFDDKSSNGKVAACPFWHRQGCKQCWRWSGDV